MKYLLCTIATLFTLSNIISAQAASNGDSSKEITGANDARLKEIILFDNWKDGKIKYSCDWLETSKDEVLYHSFF